MSRQNQAVLTLTVDGRDFGVWDKLDGGEIDSDETKYKPGGMGPAVSLGGAVEVGDLTVSRLYVLGRDTETIHWLVSRVGKGQCVLGRMSLDTDGNVWGTPGLVYSGVLKTVTPPPVDSESSDAALIEAVIAPGGTVA
jgi:hypothetical protein